MKNASLLKIIGLMVVAIALIGTALAFTSPRASSNANLFSSATLSHNIDAASAGSTALNGRDWGATLDKLNSGGLLKAGNSNAAKSLSSSTMKAVQDVLGKHEQSAASFSHDANGTLSQGGQLAQKAFDQLDNK